MNFLLGMLLFVFSLSCSANSINQLVVFGDSLSDTGNLYEYMHHQIPQSPPYFDGHFSDGPVWSERLVNFYFSKNPEIHLLNYAFGGAGVLGEDKDDDELFTLKREVDTFLLAHNDSAKPDDLYCFWIGGNNYLGLPEDVEVTVNEVITGTKKDIERLVQKGAKHILIMNLPDLGKTPLAKEFTSEAQYTVYSTLHNQRLNEMYLKLRGIYPDVHWYYFDTHFVFEELFRDPQQYGLENTTGTCYDATAENMSSPNAVIKMAANVKAKSLRANLKNNCDGFVFFDLIHPTQKIHQIAADSLIRLFEKEDLHFN